MRSASTRGGVRSTSPCTGDASKGCRPQGTCRGRPNPTGIGRITTAPSPPLQPRTRLYARVDELAAVEVLNARWERRGSARVVSTASHACGTSVRTLRPRWKHLVASLPCRRWRESWTAEADRGRRVQHGGLVECSESGPIDAKLLFNTAHRVHRRAPKTAC